MSALHRNVIFAGTLLVVTMQFVFLMYRLVNIQHSLDRLWDAKVYVVRSEK